MDKFEKDIFPDEDEGLKQSERLNKNESLSFLKAVSELNNLKEEVLWDKLTIVDLNSKLSEIKDNQDPKEIYAEKIPPQKLQQTNTINPNGMLWAPGLSWYAITDPSIIGRTDAANNPVRLIENPLPWTNFFQKWLNYLTDILS